MITRIKLIMRASLLALLGVACLQTHTAHAQGTAITYQGRLNDSGGPANGTYDFRFKLFTDSAGNNQTGSTVLTNGISVANGLFTTTVDFGSGVFNGANLWLEVSVRTNGAASYSALSPLQSLTPTPYAVFAEGASNVLGIVSSGGLSGSYSGQVTFNNSANNFSGSFTGNGGGLTNVNAATLGGIGPNGFWRTSGNSGTTAGANFIGTTDNQPLELRVAGQRALRLELIGPEAPNVIGGFSNNFVGPTLSGATIAGGGLSGASNRIVGAGFNGAIGGGRNNVVSNFNGTVSGGANNASAGNAATVGGGSENIAGGDHDVVAGGQFNASIGYHSSVAGGLQNTNTGPLAAIGGGELNVIGGVADHATIAGGGNNAIVGSDKLLAYDTIGGGQNNLIQTNAVYATIGGGSNNVVQSGTSFSTIGGGYRNANGGFAGVISGGQGNQLNGDGAALGGGYFNTNNASAGTISGGQYNFVGGLADHGTIAGGGNNVIVGAASLPVFDTIGGGNANSVLTNVSFATIAGGTSNTISSLAHGASIGGGHNNTNNGVDGVIAGGLQNSISNVPYATIGGGVGNQANAFGAVVSGGNGNVANATYGTIPGGFNVTASGAFSFAAGRQAQAIHQGAFVWADSTIGPYSSDRTDQLKVRAGGGMVLDVSGSSGLNPAAFLLNSSSANGVGMYIVETSSDAALVVNNAGTGSIIKGFNGGGNPVFEVVHDGTVYSKGIALTSDRNAKENFAAINSAQILDKVASLPITEWNFKTDAVDEKHVGPMAQDFHAAFGLNGGDDKHISMVDEGGVALAAIQGLNQKLEVRSEKLENRNQKSENRIKKLEAENAQLKERLEKLEQFILKQESN